jgi:hypothetical protein
VTSSQNDQNPTQASLDSLIKMRQWLNIPHRHSGYAPSPSAQNYKKASRGMTFKEVRPYHSGDEVRHIDWKISAKTQKLHTKLFEEDSQAPVALLVDLSAELNFATQGLFKSVLLSELAALFAWRSFLLEMPIQIYCAAFISKTQTLLIPIQLMPNQQNIFFCLETLVKIQNIPDKKQLMQQDLGVPVQLMQTNELLPYYINHTQNESKHWIATDSQGLLTRFNLQKTQTSPINGLVVQDPIEFEYLPNGHYAFTSNDTTSMTLSSEAIKAHFNLINDQLEALHQKLLANHGGLTFFETTQTKVKMASAFEEALSWR